jgi:hypothetical protein
MSLRINTGLTSSSLLSATISSEATSKTLLSRRTVQEAGTFSQVFRLLKLQTCSPYMFMSEKKIKIVKRAERVNRKRTKPKAVRKTASNIVNTVTNWVTKFEQRQREENAKAVEKLIRSRNQNHHKT